MNLFSEKKIKFYASYFALFFVVFMCLILLIKQIKASDFLTSMENKTFDLRQSILISSQHKKVSKDIVLVTIDDASYEYLMGLYGEWPVPRDVYAKFIDYIEAQNPRAIAFDAMFVKSLKTKKNADQALIDAVKKYDNVYVSMNFDYQSSDIRKPADLPKEISVKVKNDSKFDFVKDVAFTNVRTILQGLMKNNKNIGIINISRENDGILRKISPFLSYHNEFYPHLALLMALQSVDAPELEDRIFYIDRDSNLKIGDRVIPINSDGGVILNWYGQAGKVFEEVPFYKIIKSINNNDKEPVYNFKDKIVYFGTTAVSLFDTKSVPVDKLYPGVEIHATFINNFINNEFIKKVPPAVDFLISILLAFAVGYVVYRTTSTFVALGATILTSFGYTIFAYYMMKFFNIWLGIILPLVFVFVVFAATYIVKYLLKSRDFEYQYRLATTDGLTELYNHRYFQEQMILQVENARRYNTNFSLILIDIDYFKKFNDTFGHQSGDAVLKQVASKLKKNVRAADFVCRYGGEEMTIILSNTDKDEAIITAQKICQVIAEKPFRLVGNQESKVTISLGVATFPQDGNTPGELISCADTCLYRAKENGRNQVAY